MLMASVALFSALSAAAIGVGDRLPAESLDYGFPPEKVDLAARIAGKKVILVGLPGAFTPT
jgi:peroxiredoxin